MNNVLNQSENKNIECVNNLFDIDEKESSDFF